MIKEIAALISLQSEGEGNNRTLDRKKNRKDLLLKAVGRSARLLRVMRMTAMGNIMTMSMEMKITQEMI